MPKNTLPTSRRRAPGGPAQPCFARSVVLLLLLVAGLSGPWLPSALADGAPAYGVAVTPQKFPRLYQKTYALVKRVAPQTRVFVSFQWEWMRILDSRTPQRIAEHRKLVDVFRPRLDVIGLTS
ncbi:MAG: hypothetical protein V3W34_07260, partial [Phycisphaerae bacterium]